MALLAAAAEVEYCIVGAGPAGLQVANLLQQAGQTYVAPRDPRVDDTGNAGRARARRDRRGLLREVPCFARWLVCVVSRFRVRLLRAGFEPHVDSGSLPSWLASTHTHTLRGVCKLRYPVHRYLISINKKRTGRANPEFTLRHPGDTATARTTPPKGTAHSRRSKAQPPQTQAASPRAQARLELAPHVAGGERHGLPVHELQRRLLPRRLRVPHKAKTCILDSTFTQSKRKSNGHSATI